MSMTIFLIFASTSVCKPLCISLFVNFTHEKFSLLFINNINGFVPECIEIVLFFFLNKRINRIFSIKDLCRCNIKRCIKLGK